MINERETLMDGGKNRKLIGTKVIGEKGDRGDVAPVENGADHISDFDNATPISVDGKIKSIALCIKTPLAKPKDGRDTPLAILASNITDTEPTGPIIENHKVPAVEPRSEDGIIDTETAFCVENKDAETKEFAPMDGKRIGMIAKTNKKGTNGEKVASKAISTDNNG